MPAHSRLDERCPQCRRPLYAKAHTGQRITAMLPIITGPEPQQHKTILCLNPDCGYGREESGPMPVIAPPPPSLWERMKAIFGGKRN